MKKVLILFIVFLFSIILTGCRNSEDQLSETEDTTSKEEIKKPMIAFSFDDGPSPYTDRLLDALEKYGARATFFVMGYRVETYQNTIIRAVNLGNEIAGHTWIHQDITKLTNKEIHQTIFNTNRIIESVISYSPKIYRPPFGLTNHNVVQISTELGLSIVNWTLDGMDWKYKDADRVYNIIMNEVKENDVILLHDIHITTVEAMERLIPSLIAKGYQLVTVSEVLIHLYNQLEPGTIYGKVYESN